ncbi:MAG: hypothetical protein JOZ69_11435, partial [Myxococcales bacterium]|nr:hypothetical protein [Myxococcales bacterium]
MRRRAGGSLAEALVVALGVGACAAPPARMVTVAAAPGKASAEPFAEEAGALIRYHSARLSASLPLPDGRAWRIDDHSRPELVATHAPTRSRVVLSVLRAEELVGRAQCEERARARGLLPGADLRTVEDEATFTAQGFDTRIWVALAPGRGPDAPLAGHVMAFGGLLRKCFVLVFSTEVAGAAEEPVLSSRLALARTR